MAAARELGCYDAYIHVRFKMEGLTLGGVLEAPTKQCTCVGVEPITCGSQTVSLKPDGALLND